MEAKFAWKASEKLVMAEIAETGMDAPINRVLGVDLVEMDQELRRRIVMLSGPGVTNATGVVALRTIDCAHAWDIDMSLRVSLPQHTTIEFDQEPALEDLVAFAERNTAIKAEIDTALAEQRAAREQERRAEQERRHQDSQALAALVAADDLDGIRAYPLLTDKSFEAKKEAIKEIKAARFERDRQAWIDAHGSRHLQRCRDAGYNCLRLYATERAAAEAPDWALDFDDSAKWKDRACPSEKALDMLDAAKALGIGEAAEIVWLTAPPRIPDEYEYEFEEREAVVIRRYLGRYDLLRNTGVF